MTNKNIIEGRGFFASLPYPGPFSGVSVDKVIEKEKESIRLMQEELRKRKIGYVPKETTQTGKAIPSQMNLI